MRILFAAMFLAAHSPLQHRPPKPWSGVLKQTWNGTDVNGWGPLCPQFKVNDGLNIGSEVQPISSRAVSHLRLSNRIACIWTCKRGCNQSAFNQFLLVSYVPEPRPAEPMAVLFWV